ncbi:hypothetical protein D9M71_720010 [compost metagenome]
MDTYLGESVVFIQPVAKDIVTTEVVCVWPATVYTTVHRNETGAIPKRIFKRCGAQARQARALPIDSLDVLVGQLLIGFAFDDNWPGKRL